jgi:hypothetical protein
MRSHTAEPNDLANTGRLENVIQRWQRRVQALRGQVDRAADGTPLPEQKLQRLRLATAPRWVDIGPRIPHLVVISSQVDQDKILAWSFQAVQNRLPRNTVRFRLRGRVSCMPRSGARGCPTCSSFGSRCHFSAKRGLRRGENRRTMR